MYVLRIHEYKDGILPSSSYLFVQSRLTYEVMNVRGNPLQKIDTTYVVHRELETRRFKVHSSEFLRN